MNHEWKVYNEKLPNFKTCIWCGLGNVQPPEECNGRIQLWILLDAKNWVKGRLVRS